MQSNLLLSELNLLIRDTLQEAFPETVWVVAEISELKENRSGHCYLELIEKKEAGDEITARARATIWSYTYRMLKSYFETTTGRLLASGLKVRVQVSVEFHPLYGLSLNIKDIDPAYTIGDMALRRSEIINRLKTEGIFTMNKGLPLPEVPQKIAIVSSATAAGYQDFVNQLVDNFYGFVFYLKLFEATMQGTEATPSIIRALERIYRYADFFDAVIIIRGGGAQADLSCFDTYELGAHVAQFPLPIFTGIGHEKDDTVVDLVAHSRLKTPTAVAEFLISGILRFKENLVRLQDKMALKADEVRTREERFLQKTGTAFARAAHFFLLGRKNRLSNTGHAFLTATGKYSSHCIQQLKLCESRLSGNTRGFIKNQNNQLKQSSQAVKTGMKAAIENEKRTMEYFQNALRMTVRSGLKKQESDLHLKQKTVHLLNPENILRRGYTITYKEGHVVKSEKELKKEDILTTQFSDGKVRSRITEKQGKE
jgi:exodeoxyribonuclease VII large subunit